MQVFQMDLMEEYEKQTPKPMDKPVLQIQKEDSVQEFIKTERRVMDEERQRKNQIDPGFISDDLKSALEQIIEERVKTLIDVRL